MNKILIPLILVIVMGENVYSDSPINTNACDEIISEIKKVDNLISNIEF